MKKNVMMIAAAAAVSCLLTSCGGAGDGNTLETADSVIDVTNEAGSVAVNEETARAMLGAFSQKVLRLEKDLAEYRLELGTTTLLGSSACLVEAFDGQSETPAARYALLGLQCFIFDEASGEYMLMTPAGSVPVKVNTAESETAENGSDFVYDVENHKVLTEKFKKYTAEQLGIEKEITEYILTAAGNMALGADGETVYTVYVFEKDGTRTDYMLGFNETDVYCFNSTDGVFEKLG